MTVERMDAGAPLEDVSEATAGRLYEVYLTQTMEIAHVVRAASKKEARQLIVDLTYGRVDRDDPRLVATYPTHVVGQEKVAARVERLDGGTTP